MSRIIEQFRERRQFLGRIQYNNDRAPIVDMLDWLESDIETKSILDALRARVPSEPLIPKNQHFRNPPQVSNPDQACLFALFLMEQCKSTNQGLWRVAYQYGIDSRFSSSGVQGNIDAAMERFIGPLLDYIETELVKIIESFSVEQSVDLFSNKVFSLSFRYEFPNTHDAFKKLSQYCASSQADDAWNTVGNMCRDALNTYVQELRAKNLLDPSWDFKAGDTKGLLKQLVATVDTSSRFGSTLQALIGAVWDYTQVILHRPQATKEQALRDFMWTALAIAEIDNLNRSKGAI